MKLLTNLELLNSTMNSQLYTNTFSTMQDHELKIYPRRDVNSAANTNEYRNGDGFGDTVNDSKSTGKKNYTINEALHFINILQNDLARLDTGLALLENALNRLKISIATNDDRDCCSQFISRVVFGQQQRTSTREHNKANDADNHLGIGIGSRRSKGYDILVHDENNGTSLHGLM